MRRRCRRSAAPVLVLLDVSPGGPLTDAAARPELDKALACLREGDVLVITRLSHAMRSLKHLLALADQLRERGVGLVVLRQQIDTTTPTGRLVFHVLGRDR